MNLVFENYPIAYVLDKWQAAFDILTRAMGVDKLPNTVRLQFGSAPPRLEFSPEKGFSETITGGATETRTATGMIRVKINLYRELPNGNCTCPFCCRLRESTPMRTFCHEMVHVAQEATQRLTALGNGMVEFNGKVYGTPSNPRPEYEDEPWEVEARSLEGHLYSLVRHLDEDRTIEGMAA